MMTQPFPSPPPTRIKTNNNNEIYKPPKMNLHPLKNQKMSICPQLSSSEATQFNSHTGQHSLGYRLVRSTHGVLQGAYFFEIKLLDPWDKSQGLGLARRPDECPVVNPLLSLAESHPKPAWRIGWSTKDASSRQPVGANKFGYALISRGSKRYHDGIVSPLVKNNPDLAAGDVIGCYIYLPSPSEKELDRLKETNIPPNERITLSQWKRLSQLLSEPFPVRSSDSCIIYFINGKATPCAFSSLYGGIYYPSASGYMGGQFQFNFGPNFDFPPEKSFIPPQIKNSKHIINPNWPPPPWLPICELEVSEDENE